MTDGGVRPRHHEGCVSSSVQNRLHHRPGQRLEEALERLIRAGMDVARLNFSHGSHEEHARRLATLRAAATTLQKAGRRAAGPLRPQDPHRLVSARRLRRCPRRARSRSSRRHARHPSPSRTRSPSSTRGSPRTCSPATSSSSTTAASVLRVRAHRSGTRRLRDRADGGTVRDQAGVHLPSRSVRISTLTEKDKADLSFGLSLGVDYVALSFVRKAEDIRLVREICEAWGRPTPIVAKIETPAAVENLEGIIAGGRRRDGRARRSRRGVPARARAGHPEQILGLVAHLPAAGHRRDRDAPVDGARHAPDARRGERRRQRRVRRHRRGHALGRDARPATTRRSPRR